MEQRDIQNYDDEVTIDLVHFTVSILKKWKSLLLFALIGAIVGGLLHWLPAQQEETVRSREDAVLIEKMKVVATAHTQYGELERYIKYSPFMKLDSQNVFSGSAEYYIPKCEDPDQIAASFHALFEDEVTRSALCGILGISNELDLDKMIWHRSQVKTDLKIVGDMQVELKEKLSIDVGVYAASREQAQQALNLMCDALETLPEKVTPKQKFAMTQIRNNVQAGVVSELRDAQNKLRTELNEAHKAYTALEKEFSEEEYELYQEYVLTGNTSELPVELFPSNPLKKPVILAVVFGFFGCGWYAVAYLLSSEVKTVDEISGITGKNVLGIVHNAVPRKNRIDRWLDTLENRSFPQGVSTGYAAAAVAKLGNAVVLYDEKDQQLCELARELGAPAMDMISRDATTISNIGPDTQVVFLVKIGSTTKMQLQRENTICRQYGIPVAGSILVK